MTPEERELRRALESRSEEVSPEFRARLSSALAEGRPSSNFLPALAAVAAVVLVFATVGVLLLARQARNQPPPVAATTPTASPTDARPTSPHPHRVPGRAHAANGRCGWGHPQTAKANRVAGDRSAERAFLQRGLGAYGRSVPVSLHEPRRDAGSRGRYRPVSPQVFLGPRFRLWASRKAGSARAVRLRRNATQRSWLSGIRPMPGATWESLGTKGVSDRQCKGELSFVDSNRGFLDGFDPNNRPVIYHTTDGGRTWAAGKPLPDPPGLTRHRALASRCSQALSARSDRLFSCRPR